MYWLTSNLNVQSVKPRGGCYLQGLYLLFFVFSHIVVMTGVYSGGQQ